MARFLQIALSVCVFISAHPVFADIQIIERPGLLSALSGEQMFLPDPLAAAVSRLVPVSRLFLLPAEGVVSSPFGWRADPFHGDQRFHAGVDVADLRSSRVVAAATGIVAFAGWARGCGRMAVIDHGGGVQTRYCHLESLGVRTGELVPAGRVVGRMGETGRATGRHLHFELREGGRPIDPVPWLMF